MLRSVVLVRTGVSEELSTSIIRVTRIGVSKFTVTAAIYWPIVQPWMIDGDDCVTDSGMNKWEGKSKYPEKTCPSVALSAIHHKSQI
jgi:hypothetical protein